MRPLLRLVTTTLVGGVLFLVPVVLTVLLATQAVRLASRVLAPIAHLLPAQSVAGVTLNTVVAATLLLLSCFAVGLVARTRLGAYMNRRLEGAILRKVPGFTFVKSAAQGLVGLEGDSSVQAALANVEEAWVPAFVLEQHQSGLLTVFVPSVPTPAAGSIYLLPEERVRRLDVPVTAMLPVIMRLGVGLRDLLEPPGRPAPVETRSPTT